MAYRKLTKKQRKDRDRILAWMKGKQFRENRRSKPAVPDLSTDDVMEQYVPPDVTGAGQFFTPIEMASELLNALPIYSSPDIAVLDPCAGIGHLLQPLASFACRLVAYELEEECVEIGRKLFPQIQWNWEIPFDCVEKLKGQFDYVVMNPPFGTRRDIYPGQEMCQGRCSKSEHVFLELAVRACKPGGQIGVIASYNYWDKLPKELRAWLEDKASLDSRMGELPGEFALSSGISVYGYLISRLKSELCEPSTGHFLPCPDCKYRKGANFCKLLPWNYPDEQYETPLEKYIAWKGEPCRIYHLWHEATKPPRSSTSVLRVDDLGEYEQLALL